MDTLTTWLLLTGVVCLFLNYIKYIATKPIKQTIYALSINGNTSGMQPRTLEEWRKITRVWILEDYGARPARTVDLMRAEEYKNYMAEEYQAEFIKK